MYKSPSNTHQVSMFWDLASMLNPTHPMYKLANLINWETFERSFAPCTVRTTDAWASLSA